MRRIHLRHVDLEVRQSELIVVRLEVIDRLQECEVPVSNVLFLEFPDVDILYKPKELLLKGLIRILEDRVELLLEGEPVPDGGMFDAGCVCLDRWSRSEVGVF